MLFQQGGDASHRAADHNAHPFAVNGRFQQARGAQSLLTGVQRKMCGAVHAPRLFAPDALGGVEAFDLAGKLCRQASGIETGDAGNPRSPGLDALPCTGYIISQRRDSPGTGDNHPFEHGSILLA